MSTNKFFISIFFKMTEENQKNTIGTVGMRFSIIWLILFVLNIIWIDTIFNEKLMALWLILFATTLLIWIPLSFSWFILWIIWLFYKPKAKARIAILIPILSIVFINISTSAPTNEFITWGENWVEENNIKSIDQDRFESIFNSETKNIITNKSKDEWISLYKSYDWHNAIKKFSYSFLTIVKECMESSLEKYNDESYEVNSTENIDENNTENSGENIENDSTSDTQTENVEVFTKEEQNDIEQILQILE